MLNAQIFFDTCESVEFGGELAMSIIFAKADLYPDYQINTFTVRLNRRATPRDNLAVKEICQTLNDYETVFPRTTLRLVYENATMPPPRDQEF